MQTTKRPCGYWVAKQRGSKELFSVCINRKWIPSSLKTMVYYFLIIRDCHYRNFGKESIRQKPTNCNMMCLIKITDHNLSIWNTASETAIYYWSILQHLLNRKNKLANQKWYQAVTFCRMYMKKESKNISLPDHFKSDTWGHTHKASNNLDNLVPIKNKKL